MTWSKFHTEDPQILGAIAGWEDNIKKELKEIGCDGLCWFIVAPDRAQEVAVTKSIGN